MDVWAYPGVLLARLALPAVRSPNAERHHADSTVTSAYRPNPAEDGSPRLANLV